MNRSEPAARASTDLYLVVRRTIRAPAERVFAAWTQPEHLEKWWGPGEVRCIGVEMDLQVGGRYRIGNEHPDGQVTWISGEFEEIDPPEKLVYTWRIGSQEDAADRITVRFRARDSATEVIVSHQHIVDAASRAMHEQGWIGCLDGLVRYLSD